MPRKKEVVKGGAPVARIRENSRLMRTHETMVDFLSGHHSSNSILDAFASGFLGIALLRTVEGDLEDDLIYSDEDDDDDDYEHDHFCKQHGPSFLKPHPRIKLLTEEEADKHAKELIEEEERRKEKSEKKKRKKLRKKEKKRLEKESAVKDILPEEQQGKSDSSENKEENVIIENNAEANDSSESYKTQNGTAAAECDESSGDDEEESPADINKNEDEEPKDLDLYNSYSAKTKSESAEMCNQGPARDRKEKTKSGKVKGSKEEVAKVVEKPEVQKKKEEKQKPNKEKTMDSTAEELAKRSRELAGMGNRLAASGQYEMAVKCFTDAIKYNPTEFKLFGNRSLCYERLQQYEKALRDADLALSMEPNWIKGLFRKGKALCGLKRYYEASLIYKEVMELESSSAEAQQELKRAQTLHLMEMGFSWAQSSDALKAHGTLEEAVEALFCEDRNPGPGEQAAVQEEEEEDDDDGEWTVLPPSRPRAQQVKEFDAFGQSRSNSQSPTPQSRNFVNPDLFPIWVGSLAPAVTYSTLHELFSRAGTVYSIKMLLEQQCAFVNYTRKEDCDRAIQCINGMVVEGTPLSVRYPNKIHSGLGMSRSAATDPFSRLGPYKECFFWRTTGCTRQDCTYRHVPENKNVDKDKFTNRLGNFNM